MSHFQILASPLVFLLLVGCASEAKPAVIAKPNVTPAKTAAEVPACPLNASPMDGWSDRAPPRKIFGNTYYVGTCGITALLVVGSEGAILIDGATDKAPAAIEANIRALGFELNSVKYLLNTHEHSDHAGGLAQLQRDTGAPLFARGSAVETLRRGASDRRDPQFGVLQSFPAVSDVRPLADDQTVRLGDLALTAHATPGHAPGGTSWTWRACEGSRCVDIAYVDSHTAISDDDYRFIDHPDDIAAFERSIERVKALPCDLLLTPHPMASNLLARFHNDSPLINAGACKDFAENVRTKLAERLAQERAGKAQ